VLVRFLKVEKQLVDDRVAHLKPALLRFPEKIVVFVLEFFALHLLPVEFDLLLVAEVGGALLFWGFLEGGREVLGLVVDAIVVLALIKYLVAGRTTRPMLLIYSWSISDTRRCALPVLRSFTSRSFPCPYW
jgi:hypothetical protein